MEQLEGLIEVLKQKKTNENILKCPSRYTVVRIVDDKSSDGVEHFAARAQVLFSLP